MHEATTRPLTNFKWNIQSPGPPFLPSKYARFVATKPCILIGIVFGVSTAALVLCLLLFGLPNLQITSKEFFTIHTEHSAKLIQYRSLLEHGNDLPSLGYRLQNTSSAVSTAATTINSRPHYRQKRSSDERCSHRQSLRITGFDGYRSSEKLSVIYKIAQPYRLQNAVIRNASLASNILTYVAVRSICTAERKLMQSGVYKDICYKKIANTSCYDSLSLPNLMARYLNLSCCEMLTQSQVNHLARTIIMCKQFVGNHTKDCCISGLCKCPEIPEPCVSPALALLYEFVLPMSILDSGSIPFVQSIFEVPFNSKDLYWLLLEQQLGPVELAGIYLSSATHGQLYGDILLGNLPWILLALFGIICVMWLHTYSLLLTLVTVLIIVTSLGLAYFVNSLITGSNNFGMLNIMAVVVLVGIGPDDVFIMYSSWKHAKKDHRDCRIEKLVSDTVSNAGLSITVTSLTTIAAFLANLISPVVVAINAFAIYASLAVAFNLLLVLTIIPAVIVFGENHFKCVNIEQLNQTYKVSSAMLKKVYTRFLSFLSLNLRFLIHLITISIFIFCFLSTSYYPSLRYPDERHRSLFSRDNLLEKYSLKYSKVFKYQHISDSDNKKSQSVKVQVIMVWGVTPLDNRNRFVPANTVPINYNTFLDMRQNFTRLWFRKFCSTKIYKAPYQAGSTGNRNCIFNSFDSHLLQSFELIALPYFCTSHCCNFTKPSIQTNGSQFLQCVHAYVTRAKLMYYPLYQNFKPFYFEGNRLAAFQATYITNVPADSNYTYLGKVTSNIEKWFADATKDAPIGAQKPFIYFENLQVWELRKSLRNSVVKSAAAALLASVLTILLTTMNPLLAFQALIVLLATICGTFTFLLWLDWRIDIEECVILTLAFGLAVDFTLHYGIAFKLHHEPDRFARALLVLKKTSAPISFAALTTAVAGALVLPSEVLVIKMTGVFLLTVSVFAWIGAMLIFPSIVTTVGNKNANMCQFHLPECQQFCACLQKSDRPRVDLTQYELPDGVTELSCAESSNDRLLNNNINNHVSNNHLHAHSTEDSGVLYDSPIWKRREPNTTLTVAD